MLDDVYRSRRTTSSSATSGRRISRARPSAHRRRLVCQRLRAERRRQAHRDERTPSPLLEFIDRTEVWVMDANGSNAKQLTNNKVPEGNASLSPDGIDGAVHVGANEQGEIYYNDKLFLVPAAGGPAKSCCPMCRTASRMPRGARTARPFTSPRTWARTTKSCA